MRYLIATDLDNTLVGDDRATFGLNRHLRSHRSQITLVYATGRSYRSACQLLAEKKLLKPDYWITGVGTEIYHRDIPDTDWICDRSGDWNRDKIVELIQLFPQFEFQPTEEQNPRKVSLYLSPKASGEVVANLKDCLLQNGIGAQIVFSSNRDVDILPKSVDKGKALAYLMLNLNIAPHATLVCGDSGNDISLFQQPVCGTIVGNAQPELLNWYRQSGRFASGSSAQRIPHHYLAKSSYADGILEGLQYFKFLADARSIDN
jgi:sucrose-6-phosphatase